MRKKLWRFVASVLFPGRVTVNRNEITEIRRLACAAIEFLEGIIEVCDQMLV